MRCSATIALWAAALGPAACDREAPVGTVSVALGEDQCADYCLTALHATLYREGEEDLPLGPALQIGCGAEVSFPALPAGERVLVVMQAFDITGDVLLAGRSTPLTIIADGVAEAHVPLTASSPPAVRSVLPEPVVAADGAATVTVSGVFGEPLGKAALELGGVSYPSSGLAWTSGESGDTIALTLPRGARGGALAVRRCGIPSAAVDVRVIGPSAGESVVTGGPACAGLTARAAVAGQDGSVWVAWGCADGQGALGEMRLDDALCPLDPGASWTLPGAPEALAVLGASVWVGGAAGLLEVEIASAGATPRQVAGGAVSALAATAGTVYGIVDGRLARIAGGVSDVAGVDAGLVLEALAASGQTLFVAAHTIAGEGRLVSVPDGGVVTVRSLVQGDERCESPGAIAVAADGAHVALACAGGGVGVWDVQAQSFASIALPAPYDHIEGLAFDDGGDVVFASGATWLAVLHLARRETLHVFERAPAERAALLVRAPGHRLLMPSASAPLAVVTPFDAAGPCGGGAP